MLTLVEASEGFNVATGFVTSAAIPCPDKFTTLVILLPSCVIVRLPLTAPAIRGVKSICIVVDCPAFSIRGLTEEAVGDGLKTVLLETIPVILISALPDPPACVRVIDLAGDVVFTVCDPNIILLAEAVKSAPTRGVIVRAAAFA
jgi:hypothetical protein